MSESASQLASGVLQAWIINKVFTSVELADAGDVPEDTFAKYRAGTRQMPFNVAARISRFAMARKGRVELAYCFCTSEHAVVRVDATQTDGSIKDEVVSGVVALGDLSGTFEADELDAADRALDNLFRVATAGRAEVARRRGQITPSPSRDVVAG